VLSLKVPSDWPMWLKDFAYRCQRPSLPREAVMVKEIGRVGQDCD
jgi:hypothetical protein